jgi:hypothetical protein
MIILDKETWCERETYHEASEHEKQVSAIEVAGIGDPNLIGTGSIRLGDDYGYGFGRSIGHGRGDGIGNNHYLQYITKK